MSKERTLANIARIAYWDTESENQDTFDRVAKAVEKEVLARLNKSEAEPVSGQELSFVQVAKWVDRHGSTKGLQWQVYDSFAVLNKVESKAETQKKIDSGEYSVVESFDVE